MEEKMEKAYRSDIALVVGCMALIWATLLFVLFQVQELSDSVLFSVAIAVICLTSLAFLTSALIGLIAHLKRNRNSLYAEDIGHLKKNT